jgi:hypothetical protein
MPFSILMLQRRALLQTALQRRNFIRRKTCDAIRNENVRLRFVRSTKARRRSAGGQNAWQNLADLDRSLHSGNAHGRWTTAPTGAQG